MSDPARDDMTDASAAAALGASEAEVRYVRELAEKEL